MISSLSINANHKKKSCNELLIREEPIKSHQSEMNTYGCITYRGRSLVSTLTRRKSSKRGETKETWINDVGVKLNLLFSNASAVFTMSQLIRQMSPSLCVFTLWSYTSGSVCCVLIEFPGILQLFTSLMLLSSLIFHIQG